MRFLVDECTGPAVAVWLREQGHEVFSVFDEARGAEDDDVIKKAYNESWILIYERQRLRRESSSWTALTSGHHFLEA